MQPDISELRLIRASRALPSFLASPLLVAAFLTGCSSPSGSPAPAEEERPASGEQAIVASPVPTLDPARIPPWPLPLVPAGQTLTQHGNNARTGANTSETTLTPANVTPSTFGRLYTRALDGAVLAQPLYAKSIPFSIGGTTVSKNVGYVATAHNTVYAFDADDTSASPAAGILRQRTFEAPQYGGICKETWGPVGITST